MNEKPIINNVLYKNNLKSKDFFNTYMNKNNMKANNINTDSYCNTQIITNRLENDICEINNNKNKFLDRLTSPL